MIAIDSYCESSLIRTLVLSTPSDAMKDAIKAASETVCLHKLKPAAYTDLYDFNRILGTWGNKFMEDQAKSSEGARFPVATQIYLAISRTKWHWDFP